MKKFGFIFSLYVSIFISACTFCVAAFAADSKTDAAGKSLAATLSEDILEQFKNPDITYRPGGRYDGVYAKDKIAEQLVANEVKITSESFMGNLEMASGSISTMGAVYEAANKYGISVMVKPNKNDNYSQGLHHATVENTAGLTKGDKIVGTNLMTGSLIKPALRMVLAVRYTLDGKGRKIQQEVVDLGTMDFTFSYVEGETSSSGRSGFPGGGSFPGGVGPYAVWTYVEPQWNAIDDFNGSIARVQYIMRTGTAQRDLALYYHVYDTSGSDYVSYAVDDSIEEAGYTYDIVNPGYMNQKNFYAEDGVIDPTGGRYKALVVYHPLTLNKDVKTRVWNNWDFGYSWDETKWESKIEGQFISLKTANQFLDYAKKGVPIIVVGDYNTFYDMNWDHAKGENTGTNELPSIFKQIEKMGKLYTAKTFSDVAETLQKAGIQPDVRKDRSSRIVSWKQNFSTTNIGVEGTTESSNADFYWLFNYPCGDPEKEFVDKDWNMAYDKGKTITQTLYFKGKGIPFKADLWSGEVTPVANYEVTDDGYIAIKVTLEAYDTAMYCIVRDVKDHVHAADFKSNCHYKYNKNGNLYLCTSKGGTYTVKLGSGKTATLTAVDAAPAINLTSWDLSIESWTSNFGYSQSDVMDALGEGVKKDMLNTVRVSDLDTQTWSTFGTFTIKETGKEVDAKGVSGVGYYTATFDIGNNADGAILSIGKVYDTVQLWVNGQKVGISMNTLDVDISDYLVKGKNSIKIAIASDLQNVCGYNNAYTSSFQDQDGKVESLQAYGLGGPVTVTPYVKVSVK